MGDGDERVVPGAARGDAGDHERGDDRARHTLVELRFVPGTRRLLVWDASRRRHIYQTSWRTEHPPDAVFPAFSPEWSDHFRR
ncbi:hypothetical protein GCM10010340_37340 [Streptomyces griseoloalbus]|nr:hypothetical protein GCM10010340_37340 [Streptomyces albaduncus]